MTITSEVYRPMRRRTPLSSRGVPDETCHPQKKHCNFNKPNPILYGDIAGTIPKRTRTWRASAELVHANDKNAGCLNTWRVRKPVVGRNVSRSSIVHMTGGEERRRARRSTLYNSEMKDLIVYSNGPNFRREQLSEKICKADRCNKSPVVVESYKMRAAEYRLNRLNGRGSTVSFS
eukprot:TRINITY_DN2910_c0_g7_i1.p1 TRINITY_DN2910_c0_g7~~TRINITY_DN2910_c0_g7_i1.p1  ORF type:complete len:176 (-),score=15.78 TRINITY_DN2910_c0_g7_i1:99-626(-)